VKSIGAKMNNLCLEVVMKVMSTIAWHSTLNISETVRRRSSLQHSHTGRVT